MDDLTGFGKLADASKELVKPIYEDLAQPAVQEIGRNLETVAKAVRVIVAPLSALVWGYDKLAPMLETKVIRLLEERETKLVRVPDLRVVGPAVENMRYSAEVEEIRELYARLIASAIDDSSADDVHPSFVEILNQLTRDEAIVLPSLMHKSSQPAVSPIIRQKPKSTPHMNLPLMPEWSVDPGWAWSFAEVVDKLHNRRAIPAYVNNLARLSVIRVQPDVTLNEPAAYETLEKCDSLQHFVENSLVPALKQRGDGELHLRRDSVQTTAFGWSLVSALFPAEIKREQEKLGKQEE